jgi:hypothetical protein
MRKCGCLSGTKKRQVSKKSLESALDACWKVAAMEFPDAQNPTKKEKQMLVNCAVRKAQLRARRTFDYRETESATEYLKKIV